MIRLGVHSWACAQLSAATNVERYELTVCGELRPYHVAKVEEVCFSPDGTRIASGGFNRTAKLWDAVTDEAGHSER